MEELIEIGKVSARGQIAIPIDIRRSMNLHDGEKVLFFLENETLLVKKLSSKTFAEISKPLRDVAEKAGMKESDVPAMIQRFRAQKRK